MSTKSQIRKQFFVNAEEISRAREIATGINPSRRMEYLEFLSKEFSTVKMIDLSRREKCLLSTKSHAKKEHMKKCLEIMLRDESFRAHSPKMLAAQITMLLRLAGFTANHSNVFKVMKPDIENAANSDESA